MASLPQLLAAIQVKKHSPYTDTASDVNVFSKHDLKKNFFLFSKIWLQVKKIVILLYYLMVSHCNSMRFLNLRIPTVVSLN